MKREFGLENKCKRMWLVIVAIDFCTVKNLDFCFIFLIILLNKFTSVYLQHYKKFVFHMPIAITICYFLLFVLTF